MTPITVEQLDLLIWKAYAKEILQVTSDLKAAVRKRLQDDQRISFVWR